MVIKEQGHHIKGCEMGATTNGCKICNPDLHEESVILSKFGNHSPC